MGLFLRGMKRCFFPGEFSAVSHVFCHALYTLYTKFSVNQRAVGGVRRDYSGSSSEITEVIPSHIANVSGKFVKFCP